MYEQFVKYKKRKLPKDNFLKLTTKIYKFLSNQTTAEQRSENKAYNGHKLDKYVD